MKLTHTVYMFILIVSSALPYSSITAQDNPPTLIFGASEDIGIEDAVALYAYEALKEKGYEIEVTRFAESSFSIDALSNNDTNFATHSSRTVWSAIANGAKVKTVVEYTGMDFVMVGNQGIETCDDWEGTTIAYNSETSMTAAIGNYYFETICTDYSPDVVFVSGSSNRVAGMIAGVLNATVVHLDAALVIIEDSPDDFYIVANLPQDFPWLVGAGLHVSTDFAEEHPEIVQDVVNTFVEVLQGVNDDPSDFILFATELMDGDLEEFTEIINIYIEEGLLDVVTDLSEDNVKRSLEFFIGTGDLPEDLTSATIVDLTYIENALVELDSE